MPSSGLRAAHHGVGGGMAFESVAGPGLLEEVASWSQSSRVEGFHPLGGVGPETFKGPCQL